MARRTKEAKKAPKVNCKVTFPSAGAERVRLALVRMRTVYARAKARRSGDSVTLSPRRELHRGRYTLRIATSGPGGRHLSRSSLRLRVG